MSLFPARFGARRYRVSRALAALAAVLVLSLAAGGALLRSRGQAPVLIDAADFELGARDGEGDEKPVHRVHVARFAIERREVSVGDYARCVEQKRCTPAGTFHERCVAKSGGSATLPINCVTFAQASAYCSFHGGRLPTEVEWEYAARRGEQRHYAWGNQAPTTHTCWQKSAPCAVASSSQDRSPYGVMDLAGNVSEWTSSPYCDYADAKRCKPGVRVTRGGSFDLTDPSYLRATYRDWVKETDAGYNLGVRCAFPAP